MKNLKLAWIALTLILSGSLACGEVLKQAYPAPTVIEMKADTHFFADPDVLITLRNKGASGKILLTIKQGGKTWKRIVYFDSEEQRQVKITCPGLTSGEYGYEGKPADLATAEELRGAYGGSD